jgi:hypothetical protein
MNPNLTYQMALARRDELLRRAAERRHAELLTPRTHTSRTTRSTTPAWMGVRYSSRVRPAGP